MQNTQTDKIWFRRKRYGFGWTPVTWQGWLTTLIYIFLLVDNFRQIDAVQYSSSDTLINFAPRFIILTTLFILICRWKGEEPKWSWG